MTARSKSGEQAKPLDLSPQAIVRNVGPRTDAPYNNDREVSAALEAVDRVAEAFDEDARRRMRADIVATYSIIQQRG